MAELIKLHKRPCKFLLRNKLGVLPSNQILSHARFKKKLGAITNLAVSIETARRAIKDFLEKKATLAEDFAHRRLRRHKRRVVQEVILLVIDFLRNLHNEAKAINSIAHEIALNITNSPLSSNDEHLGDDVRIEAELAQGMSLKLYIPKNNMDAIAKKYHNLSSLMGISGLFACCEKEGILMRLSSEEICLDVCLDERDLNVILKNVCKYASIDIA